MRQPVWSSIQRLTGERGEHDGQVRFDGVALAVVDRPGLQVVLGHAEGLLDLRELVVGADHELRGVGVPSGRGRLVT